MVRSIATSFVSNEKEFQALAKDLRELREMMVKVFEVQVKNQIRFEAWIAGLYEKHSISQDILDEIKSMTDGNHKELMDLLRKYGKKRDGKD